MNLERVYERNVGINAAVYRDYNDMLQKEDIDVINIMTPSGMHAEHALDIMNRYKKTRSY